MSTRDQDSRSAGAADRSRRPAHGSASPAASRSSRGPCRARGRGARAGDQPVEPAVRDRSRRAHARRPCRLRHADRWRAVRRPAVVPYAIGVDIGCGVALVETDLTVETLAAGELDRGARPIDRRRARPASTSSGRTGRPRGRAAEAIGLRAAGRRSRTPGSTARCAQLGHAGRWQPLPRGPAGRGRPGLRDAPLRLAEPGQDDLRRVPQAGTRAEPALARAAPAPTSSRTCRSARTTTSATGRRWSSRSGSRR